MNNTTILIIVGALIVLSAGIVFWVLDRNDFLATDIPDDWQLYQNAEFGFEIRHPPQATIQQEGETRIRFMYLGGPQATGEVTDGFTLTVGTHEMEVGQNLQQFVEANYQEQLQTGTSLQSPRQADMHGIAAYHYRIETLGEVDVYVVAGSGQGRAHTISHITADPRNRNYEQMVQNMLSTFRTIPVEIGPTNDEPDGSAENGVPGQQPPTVGTISLAMLNIGDEGEGERFGCDYLAMVERDIPPTTAPLTAAMRELFSIATTTVNGHYNFMANTNDTLSFVRAEVADGTASIYLSGELSGLTGVCDNPRASIQIEQTALQFPTVDDVQIYLNGQPTDLMPEGE